MLATVFSSFDESGFASSRSFMLFTSIGCYAWRNLELNDVSIVVDLGSMATVRFS